ncbi:MAG: hypothetical protein JXA73_08975 [Acidobacteria bacterium]|nr:hypothetical protein [Acidobacteriota bacterium]
MQIDLTREEISAIAEDCEAYLESIHVPPVSECEDLTQCPEDHFDNDGFPNEVPMRQALLKKLDKALRR